MSDIGDGNRRRYGLVQQDRMVIHDASCSNIGIDRNHVHMYVNGQQQRTIWEEDANPPRVIRIIDQRFLPHQWVIEDLTTVQATANAISQMHVRGAGLIGATAGYGMYLAALQAPTCSTDACFQDAAQMLANTRPTAVNLIHAVQRQLQAIAGPSNLHDKRAVALATARAIADEDAEACRLIGQHGLPLIEQISRRKKGQTVHVLTHCNAGWLAFVDHGSATAPIYATHDAGMKIHVWVDETRPRNQGAALTAWELGQHGVPHTVIADNTGGHLMQHGQVDAVLVGSDRTTRNGDVANKIGTYLKALAAADNHIPMYAAMPSSTIDWSMTDGVANIPIEQRNPNEVLTIQGLANGQLQTVRLAPEGTTAANYGFDVTPARLITAIITERGVCAASEAELLELYPEHR